MAFIKYKFADGHVEAIEVTEEFKREYEKMEKEERRIERKETRRHLSLEMLLEQEERRQSWGSLENKSLKMNQNTFSFISSELDPLEALLQKEEKATGPIMEAFSLYLTDYQRKIAIEYYINNKTYQQIAGELGISRPAVGKIIKKVRMKVFERFI